VAKENAYVLVERDARSSGNGGDASLLESWVGGVSHVVTSEDLS